MSVFKKIKERFENKKNIVRVQKNQDNPYVVMNKSCLNDSNLSWAAKGLHSYLLSLPDDWEIYVNELVKHTSAGRDHTYRVINELLKNGYMQKTQYRCEGKVLGLNYTVFEVSTGEDNTKAKISNVTLSDNGEIVEITSIEPNTESTETDEPDTDYTTLLNNNNNKIITKQNNDSVVVVDEKETQLLEMYKSFKIEKRVMPHTIKLLKEYKDNFDLEVFQEVFIAASEDSVEKKFAYIRKTLLELSNKNIKTLSDMKKDKENYKPTKGSNNTKTINNKKEYEVKTRAHNINQTFKKYTPDELEKNLQENQKHKFESEDKLRADKEKQAMKQQEITREFADKCISDFIYFKSLSEDIKESVKSYVKNNGMSVPFHMM